MSVPSNTLQTYQNIGIREELSDAIYNISPEDHPYMSNAGRDRVENTFFEYQQDELAAVDADNAHLEGDDDTTEASTPPSRVGAHVQIFKKSFRVSGTNEAVRKAGRKSDLAYQKAKKSAELKNDIESALLANVGTSAGAAGSARYLAGLGAWVKTAVDKEGTGTNPVYTSLPSDPRNDGALRSITETMLKNVLHLSWVEGGKTSTLMVGGTVKQAVSAFAGIATKTIQQSKGTAATIIGAADVYVGDFGTLAVVPNRLQRTRDAWLLDFSLIDVVYLRTFKDVELAKTGDSTRRMLIAELGHKVKQEAGLGLIADVQA
jgi:hypothetical protein